MATADFITNPTIMSDIFSKTYKMATLYKDTWESVILCKWLPIYPKDLFWVLYLVYNLAEKRDLIKNNDYIITFGPSVFQKNKEYII